MADDGCGTGQVWTCCCATCDAEDGLLGRVPLVPEESAEIKRTKG